MDKNKPISTPAAVGLSVAVTLVVLFIGILLAKTLAGQIGLNAKVLNAKIKARDQLQKNLDAVDPLRQAYSNLGGKIQIIKDSLPNSPDFPALGNAMENLTAISGVKFKAISADNASAVPAASGSLAQPYTFKVSVDGNYDTIIRLLSNIETSARPMRVTALTLAGSTPALSADASITTYYQGPADLSLKTEVVK